MAKSAGQMTAYRFYAADRASRIKSHLTPEQKIQLKRSESRRSLRNSFITLTTATAAIPLTGGASGFVAIPAFMCTLLSTLDVVAAHLETV